MTKAILRIHPSIGLSRVGNSEEYYLAPESIAALPQRGKPNDPTTGGLPIRPGTENEIVKSSELRDARGAFKRQAARFRIFQYPESAAGQYPAPGDSEVMIGSMVDGRKVADILWTVHVANKKAAWFESDDDHGAHAFDDGQTPALRNLTEGLDPYNRQRLRKLVIDPGPRAIRGTDGEVVPFDRETKACHVAGDQVVGIADYPQSFPDKYFPILEEPQGRIDTLGELRTDDQGRLIVTGGHGKAVGWPIDESDHPVPIKGPVNNDQWFDDTSDGPVSATLVFEDENTAEVQGGWVITTDPSYAPQTLNVVSLWDDAYDAFVRKLQLDTRIYSDGSFNETYRPSFPDHLHPLFRATAQQLWNTYLPDIAIDAHRDVGEIKAEDDPNSTILAGLAFIRRPEPGDEASWKSNPSDVGAPLMPLSLGDTSKAGGKSFLSPSYTQYFFLERWAAGAYEKEADTPLGDGEYLDRAALQNCLGGRFSPGIDMTWIIREPEMYEDWKQGAGPFRIKHQPLDYRQVRSKGPFLGLGWVPRHPEVMSLGLEPGDASKFMALPWHADYNSCAIHQTAPNPLNSNSLFWSWPGQRPVTVYVAKDYDVEKQELPAQRYSVRGPGTFPGENTPDDKNDMANAGRFWDYRDMLDHWDRIGTIVQATIIDDGRSYPEDVYLEVESQLENGPKELADPHPWPLIGGSGSAGRKP